MVRSASLAVDTWVRGAGQPVISILRLFHVHPLEWFSLTIRPGGTVVVRTRTLSYGYIRSDTTYAPTPRALTYSMARTAILSLY